MELYYYPLSTNSQKVRLLLEEKKIQCRLIPVDILRAANLEPEFLSINGNGTVPVLVDGETVLTDSKNILEYLDKIGKPMGFGSVDIEIVEDWVQKISSWDDQVFTYGHMPKNQSIFLTKFKRRVCIARMARNPNLASSYSRRLSYYQSLEQEMQDGESMQFAKERLSNLLKNAERELGNNLFLAGSEFSTADACFAPVLARILSLGLYRDLIRPRLKLQLYFRRMQSRKSYRRAIGRVMNSIAQFSIEYPTWMSMNYRKVVGHY